MQNITEQQWEPVILNKKKQNKEIKKNISTQKTGEEQIEKMDKEISKQKKISNILRKNIQTARLNKKLTQKQLAVQSGVDIKTISEIETGTAIFNENYIRKIEKIVGKIARK